MVVGCVADDPAPRKSEHPHHQDGHGLTPVSRGRPQPHLGTNSFPQLTPARYNPLRIIKEKECILMTVSSGGSLLVNLPVSGFPMPYR
jgi:hypothetical protein